LTKFSALGLSKPIELLLQDFGYIEPTEIQERAMPLILSGKDLMASAQTGSGKTAAYALPIIERLQHIQKDPQRKPKALVLVPTRELTLQVEEQFKQFSKPFRLQTVTLYGGTGYDRQNRILRRGADIVVATPGRLLDHIQRKTVDFRHLEVLVLDEADRMLDMGFMPQVRRLISALPSMRQTLMFSATIDSKVERIAKEFLKDPITVQINSKQVEPIQIEQNIHHIDEFGKDALLARLINELQTQSVLVFTRTKRKAGWVKNRLCDANIKAEEIHGDISQSKRERTLLEFRSGVFSVLVATDIAARGLDIPSISHVINYDLPDSPQDYVHRIGRTGRAGRAGVALSFVSQDQRHLVRNIEKITGKQIDSNRPEPKIMRTSRFRRRSSRRRIV
jgi:ATP-dependent RNA helicase RhlE